MRSGVRSRPSRVGSSPSRTSNSRNSSAVLADINVTGSSAFLTTVPQGLKAQKLLIVQCRPKGLLHPFGAAALQKSLKPPATPCSKSLYTNLSSTGIFKGVEHGFFHPDFF